ncbi:hypothetical protein ElyMa_003583100 [Elysia marginata]|uniref:Secreted protein n=1 Tax=Elysia marginata TaxID=1093978 RepID=A0AAV4EPR7_9GAST|nr:hypothetical protein ElyMa_003583100 [Elysia marginata]
MSNDHLFPSLTVSLFIPGTVLCQHQVRDMPGNQSKLTGHNPKESGKLNLTWLVTCASRLVNIYNHRFGREIRLAESHSPS